LADHLEPQGQDRDRGLRGRFFGVAPWRAQQHYRWSHPDAQNCRFIRSLHQIGYAPEPRHPLEIEALERYRIIDQK